MTATTTGGYIGIDVRNEFFNVPNNVPVHVNGDDSHDVIYGYSQDDHLIGGLGWDLIFGLAGNDMIYGDDYWNDETVFASSFAFSAGADMIFGGNGDDTIFAAGGNNYVNGGLGADYIVGGNGWEVLQGGANNDTIVAGGGDDILVGGTRSTAENAPYLNVNFGVLTTDYNGVTDAAESNSFTISNYAGTDLAVTNTGQDHLDGGYGNDTLIGGDGLDTMIGGYGNDTFYVDFQLDSALEFAGQGYDVVYSSAFMYTIADSIEKMVLTDGAVKGIGNADANTMIGTSGNNLLDGGDGADELSGLGGDDIFVFRAGEAQGDVVYEFNGNGAASGDVLMFVGFGTTQQGASFAQLDAIHWQVTSWDGSISETITLMPNYTLDTTHDVMFV